MVGTLKRAFAGELPGVTGQRPMAPRPRQGWEPGRFMESARAAGVLVLLYPGSLPRPGEATLLLTVRSRELPHHAGQVSLPGGAVEPGESAQEAALREIGEEIGVDPSGITILGGLTRLDVPVSRFVLHPFVGTMDGPPQYTVDRAEVARVIELPVGKLIDSRGVGVESRTHGLERVQVPFFEADGEKVWGATAMVLSEFLTLLGQPPDPWN